MRSKTFLVVLAFAWAFVIPHSTHAQTTQERKAMPAKALSHADLKTLAQDYVSFLKTALNSDTPVTQDEIRSLFADQCTKIENGNVLFTASSDLSQQLTQAHKAVGNGFQIETLWIIASPTDRACTLQIKWWSPTVPAHTTMVSLFMDETGKITKIAEVYNQFQPPILGGK